ncbi:MAG: hypothetical protein GWN86_29880 [Desulfobacterales bacterium]|nr:hypothetical protein [Desulfobacterales bacterium]
MRWGVVPFGTILVVFSASLFPVGGGGFGDVLPGFYNPFWGGDTLSVTKRYYTWGGPGVDGGGAVMLGAGKSLYLVGGTDLYGPRGGDFVLLKWSTGGRWCGSGRGAAPITMMELR